MSASWSVTGTRAISYEIELTDELFSLENPLLRHAASFEAPPNQRIVVSDATVWELYGAQLDRYAAHNGVHCDPILLDPHESAKELDQVVKVLDACCTSRLLRRRTPLVAFGGGTVLDIAGVAACLYRRGVPLVRIPTTLVGMIDAGIGVKSAVNHLGRKSAVGSYNAPRAVLVDTAFLGTLPEREVRSGLSEALKIALVCDAGLFALIEHTWASQPELCGERAIVTELVKRSIAAMISELEPNLWEDELSRKADFGHSFSPGIEIAALPRLTHVDAVGLDIALSVALSVGRGLITSDCHDRILSVLERAGLATFDDVMTLDLLLAALGAAANHRDGLQRIPLLEDVGHVIFVNDVAAAEVDAAIQLLRTRSTANGDV